MRYDVWIDRGGTFTDCVLHNRQTGELRVLKVLSSDDAPLIGIRQLLGLGADETIPPCEIRMGTTLATNALLERKGARTLLVISRGFGDVLEIGTQARPELFALEIRKPKPLYEAVLEVDARANPDGTPERTPDLRALGRELEAARARGLSSAAIVVLHDYERGTVERPLCEAACAAGFEHAVGSHELAPEIGVVARGDTAVLDAYLTPVLSKYFAALARDLSGSRLLVMQSSGGLSEPARCRGPHAILSGPAGGAVAALHVAARAGFRRAIAFDMGGTSTDVSRIEGELEHRYETEVAGVLLRAPMLAIHTVAAGGGSLCRYDGHRLSVGPESAGARPGPLCYGAPEAAELALTDVNLALGRVLPFAFPFPLETTRVHARLQEIADAIGARGGALSPLEVAEGFFRIANQNMADAIREVSVKRGHDVRDHALIVFGGAGGQHACALARELGVRQVLFHPLAGVLSAYGMGLADLSTSGTRELGARELDDAAIPELQGAFDELEVAGRAALSAEGARTFEARRKVELGYRGTDHALLVDAVFDANALRERFEARHRAEFGYTRPSHSVELRRARLTVLGRTGEPVAVLRPPRGAARPRRPASSLFWNGQMLSDVPVFERSELEPGARIAGPAIVTEATSTIVVDPGFELAVRDDGLLVATPVESSEGATRRAASFGSRPDPILLELVGSRFMSIAERMGHTLRRTALSVNIRERLDFSCAVFDAQGGLVANAPHIPVHLGAMSESVRAVHALHPDAEPGDAFVTNDPALGGSHLPDVTVVAPVHDASGRRLAFVAARGHHADIGGVTPGSMPAFSSSLAEEGIVFRAERIVHRGHFERDRLLARLAEGPHPARRPEENVADIEAALAALHTGSALLLEAARDLGADELAAYMGYVQDYAAALVTQALAALGTEERSFLDALDDGTPIAVTWRPGPTPELDFSGTGAQVAGNLNAPRAVTVAAVLYVLRTLVGRRMPLNGGFLRPVRLRIPRGSVLDPLPGAAVAGGNVETSQRVVDVLFGAFGVLAASQGTMNNLSFGDERFGYYETIAGGAGAGATFDGASAVHTHMTNTRITDPEVLERRFPVRLREMSIRRGSGGLGRHRGGDGICREFEFSCPLSVSLLAERRTRVPFGLRGGESGASGRDFLNGKVLSGKTRIQVSPGDVLRIETPGGGGFGSPRG
ncbi:MAG TPA: hydantoinase B/oxoprolinase family protein [Polyangiaceae bacterium]|nr:hydantoinase B/oxoprolinase family protein [Polyangiaceae bacterium]